MLGLGLGLWFTFGPVSLPEDGVQGLQEAVCSVGQEKEELVVLAYSHL